MSAINKVKNSLVTYHILYCTNIKSSITSLNQQSDRASSPLDCPSRSSHFARSPDQIGWI